MPGCSGGPVVTNARAYYTTRAGAGAWEPGIPHALNWAKNSCTTRAHRAAGSRSCISPSLRGALATKQSSFLVRGGKAGLLRGACHRARIRATRWLAMTVSKSSPLSEDLNRKRPVDDPNPLLHVRTMTTTKLDLTGLKCPLPAFKTRTPLKALQPGDRLEVHCTDPLSVIYIPNLIRETRDKGELSQRTEQQPVFLIDNADATRRSAGRAVLARHLSILDWYRPIANTARYTSPVAL